MNVYALTALGRNAIAARSMLSADHLAVLQALDVMPHGKATAQQIAFGHNIPLDKVHAVLHQLVTDGLVIMTKVLLTSKHHQR